MKKTRQLTESEAIATVLREAKQFKVKKPKMLSSSTIQQKARLSALMRQAEDGRLEQVKMTLDMEPEQLDVLDENGHTAFQRLLSIERSLEQERVFEFLKQETIKRYGSENL